MKIADLQPHSASHWSCATSLGAFYFTKKAYRFETWRYTRFLRAGDDALLPFQDPVTRNAVMMAARGPAPSTVSRACTSSSSSRTTQGQSRHASHRAIIRRHANALTGAISLSIHPKCLPSLQFFTLILNQLGIFYVYLYLL